MNRRPIWIAMSSLGAAIASFTAVADLESIATSVIKLDGREYNATGYRNSSRYHGTERKSLGNHEACALAGKVNRSGDSSDTTCSVERRYATGNEWVLVARNDSPTSDMACLAVCLDRK